MQNPFRQYMDACFRNDVEVVKDNLRMVGVNYQDPVSRHHDYNGLSNYSTGLMVAVSNKSNDVARLLLAQPDIKVNRTNIEFVTALHVAVLDHNQEIVEELLKRKDVGTTMKTVHGETPKDYARDKPDILELFRKYSAVDDMEEINSARRMNVVSPMTSHGCYDCHVKQGKEGLKKMPTVVEEHELENY